MADGGSAFVVDNRVEKGTDKDVDYLRKWCNASDRFDIATGYFEISALRQLDGQWQKLDKIRILMGDQTSKQTKAHILNAILSRLDESFEQEKIANHFMHGVPAILEAIQSGLIEIKVYTKHKFHAKLYLTHAKPELEVVPSIALVGSSNFTIPGISKNIELNVRIDPQSQVRELQDWFDHFWEQAEDVSDEVIQTIDRHVREYEPFLVYGKALEEYFRGRDTTIDTWYEDDREVAEGNLAYSQMWWRLDKYQQDGYQNIHKVAATWGGAFLCDGVGLGKTYVGLMLLEKLAGYDRKRVLLLSPKSVHDAVWADELSEKLGHLYGGNMGNIHALKHTDLINLDDNKMSFIMNYFDAIVIDEGHHFRNRQKNKRYARLMQLINGGTRKKQVYFLTATPINNDILDLYRMISLFTNDNDNHFASVGIHNLRGHFKRMRQDLNRIMFGDEEFDGDVQSGFTREDADERLKTDDIVRTLIVQRSRNFVRASMEGADRDIIFPKEPIVPKVGQYNLEDVYGDLLKEFEKAFSKTDPLFKLSIYYPFDHYLGSEEEDEDFGMTKGRLAAIARLIRTGFLKRFESSFLAFKVSCHNLLLKNVKWLDLYGRIPGYEDALADWMISNEDHVKLARDLNPEIEEETDDEDYLHDLPDHHLTDWADEGDFNIEGIVKDTYEDMDQIVLFLSLMGGITPETDDKVRKLVEILESDEMAVDGKVIIFSEFMTTARYLKEELTKRLPNRIIAEIDSQTKENRTRLIQRFSPYYNKSSSPELEGDGKEEIEILISTDVLAEGLNLQDSVRLINYDIHWNPVRLMQRIGRIDRRMDPKIEARIVAEHPEREADRGNITYWNFLPPDQLDDLLGLFERVSGKYLQISKLLGIEGGFGLTEEQELDHMKDFNELYRGKRTIEEELRLRFQTICREHEALRPRWQGIPTQTISGKRGDGRFAFFCYAIPGLRLINGESGDDEVWTLEDGESRWYLYDFADDTVTEETIEMMDIHDIIECEPSEERVMNIGEDGLSAARHNIEEHIYNTILKQLKVPMGHEPELRCWMSIG